jgi:hypothetical protein
MIVAMLMSFSVPPPTPVPAIHFKQWDRCAGSGYKIDDPIRGTDPTRIVYIIKVVDRSGQLVGWIYTTKSAGKWVEGNPRMSGADRTALRIGKAPSIHEDAPAVRLLKLPMDLHAVECSRSDISNSPPS